MPFMRLTFCACPCTCTCLYLYLYTWCLVSHIYTVNYEVFRFSQFSIVLSCLPLLILIWLIFISPCLLRPVFLSLLDCSNLIFQQSDYYVRLIFISPCLLRPVFLSLLDCSNLIFQQSDYYDLVNFYLSLPPQAGISELTRLSQSNLSAVRLLCKKLLFEIAQTSNTRTFGFLLKTVLPKFLNLVLLARVA